MQETTFRIEFVISRNGFRGAGRWGRLRDLEGKHLALQLGAVLDDSLLIPASTISAAHHIELRKGRN